MYLKHLRVRLYTNNPNTHPQHTHTHMHARTHAHTYKNAHTHTHTHAHARTYARTHTHNVYGQCYSKTNLLCVATAWQSQVWTQVGHPELFLHRTDPCRTFRKLQDTVCSRSAFLPAECRASVTERNKKRMDTHICPSTTHTHTQTPPPPHTHTHARAHAPD